MINHREDGGHGEGSRTRVAGTTAEKMLGPLRKSMRNSTWKEKLASACLDAKLAGSGVLGYADVDAGAKRRTLWKRLRTPCLRRCGTPSHLEVERRDGG